MKVSPEIQTGLLELTPLTLTSAVQFLKSVFVQAHISDPTAELFALKQKPGMSAAQLRLAVDNIYQHAKREGTELKENVLVTAYLQAL